MTNWRFRTTWDGKLVLQKCVARDGPSEEWYDAKTEDLFYFYNMLIGKK